MTKASAPKTTDFGSEARSVIADIKSVQVDLYGPVIDSPKVTGASMTMGEL